MDAVQLWRVAAVVPLPRERLRASCSHSLCGSTLACRRCRQLAYDSQRDSGWRRSINQARVARMKLGGSANLTEPLPERPKGMHWRAYSRLYTRATGREQAFLADTMNKLTSFERRISRSYNPKRRKNDQSTQTESTTRKLVWRNAVCRL